MTTNSRDFPRRICELSFADELSFDPGLTQTELETALVPFTEAVMDYLQVDAPVTLGIFVADDAYVQEMNRTYRGVDAPTDILSFEGEALPPELAEEETPHLGDLIFAYPYTLHEAQTAGHAPLDEFKLLVIHGILHLLGYTHDDSATQQAMWAKQAELLQHFGVAIIVPDYIHGTDDTDDE